MAYARSNPDRIRGQLMPVIVYDPQTGRRAFTVAMEKLSLPDWRSATCDFVIRTPDCQSPIPNQFARPSTDLPAGVVIVPVISLPLTLPMKFRPPAMNLMSAPRSAVLGIV